MADALVMAKSVKEKAVEIMTPLDMKEVQPVGRANRSTPP